MSRFQRMIGGWLGLLAILMASLAPTVSHTLALHHARERMEAEHCDMASMQMAMSVPTSVPTSVPMSMPMRSMQDESAAPDQPSAASAKDTHAQHTAMPDDDACGYCSLLAHLPVMPSVAALFVVSVLTFERTVGVRFESVRRAEPLTFAQPRAPPFIA